MVKAAVVILNWNKTTQTRQCLQTAQEATTEAVRWIVVDNGSSEPVGELDADVELLRSPENLGFAGGVNLGMRHAFASGAEHVWLLNNDAEALPGALDRLLAASRADPRVGLASAVILNADANDAVECHGGVWDNRGYRSTVDPAEYALWEQTLPQQIWLLGTALLVSRSLVEAIGYFDESLFAYWEDADISRRSAAAGFRNVVIPGAEVRHESGHPAENPAERPPYYYYYMTRNELALLRKTRDLTNPRLTYWALRRIGRLYKRVASLPAQRRAVRRGVVDAILGRGGPYRA